MKLDDFFKFLAKLPVDDYVIRLKLKYDHDKDYRYTNELLLYDGSDYEGSIYHWDNDWDEGQHDVQVVGYIPVSEIDTFHLPVPDAYHGRHCKDCNHLIFRDYKHNDGSCALTSLRRSFNDICVHEEEMS